MTDTVAGTHVRSPKSYLAGAAIQQYRAVMVGADQSHVVQATAAAATMRGIAWDNQDVVDRAVAIVEDPSDKPLWEAGAAYAAGVKLTSDATGRAVLATAGQPVLAFAIEAATAAGQLRTVRLVSPGTVVG